MVNYQFYWINDKGSWGAIIQFNPITNSKSVNLTSVPVARKARQLFRDDQQTPWQSVRSTTYCFLHCEIRSDCLNTKKKKEIAYTNMLLTYWVSFYRNLKRKLISFHFYSFKNSDLISLKGKSVVMIIHDTVIFYGIIC